MSMTTSQIGNGSGYLYVTAADGLTILNNIENTSDAWRNVIGYAYVAASLSDNSVNVDATFGYRFFGNTTGAVGDLTGATELTTALVGRPSQMPRPARPKTLSGGVALLEDRPSNDFKVTVDTEGGAGTDDLDTLTIGGCIDNDTVTLVGANSARIVTVKHGTGNIFLANDTDYATGGRQNEIVLRYFSAATAGWYEVSRSATLPTVAALRAQSIPEPASGTNVVSMATSGTFDFVPGTDKGWNIIEGSPVLIGGIVFQPDPLATPLDGDWFIFEYRATPTIGAQTVTLGNIVLTDAQAAAGNVVVYAVYHLLTTTWKYWLVPKTNGIDVASVAYVLANFELALGNPASDGMVLSSTAAGVRSWASNTANNVLHNDTSNSATTAIITQEVLKTYTLPGDTMNLDGDTIVIRAIYQTAANANGKTVSLYFGATQIGVLAFDMNNDTVIVEAEINRMGGTTQSAQCRIMVWDTTTATTAVASSFVYSLPTETLSADLDIECRATNAIAAASDIVCKQFSVRIFHKLN